MERLWVVHSIMASESDRLLIQQIRQADPRAWEDLIARYEGRLLAFVQRRLQDRAASEDVVQETFIGFLNSLPNFDDRRELQTYLFTIASHKLTDQMRRTGRHPLHSAADDVLEGKRDHQPAVSSMARGQERRDLEQQALADALAHLIHDWQTSGEFGRLKVMELLLVKGMANRDVAKQLKVSEQQVANYRFAAIKKIRADIQDAGLPADVFPELSEA